MSNETQPRGPRVITHDAEPLPPDTKTSRGDRKLVAAMERHLDECFGARKRRVLREMVSPIVRLDMHVIEPSEELPLRRFVTSGMAERRMNVPAGFEYSPYAELTIALPRKTKMRDERMALALLADLARSTHRADAFVWDGHTAAWTEPIWRRSPFSSVLVITPYRAPEAFDEFKCGARTVNILGLVPLHDDELELCHTAGVDELHARFDAAGVDDVLDLTRPSVA